MDPSILDRDPEEMVPLQDDVKKIPIKDHPKYAKYFQMLKVGLPKEIVRKKMMQEGGVNPDYIDKDPEELIPEKEEESAAVAKKPAIVLPVKKGPTVRKKRLHWKGLDASKVSADSLWFDTEQNDIHLDEAEFNQLFVDTSDAKASESAKVVAPMSAKKQKVNLVDMKRGQNAAIALSRIKMSFEELKRKIMNMDDSAFTIDQLQVGQTHFSYLY